MPVVENPEYHLVMNLGIPHTSATNNDVQISVPSVSNVSGPTSSNGGNPPQKSSEEESDHEYYNDFDRLKRELQPLRRNETTV